MSPKATPTVAPTVRIINPNRLYMAFGPYLTGQEYEVTREVAARLAPRGFVIVPAATTPPANAPVED
jgi:copper oxidase (laccase) domain-containing protein